MAISEKDILKALSVIIDPDFNRDIVSLGFVKNIQMNGGQVAFDIELTTPACPVKSEFQKKAEEIVGKLAGVKGVSVNMTSKPRQENIALQNPQSTLKKVRSIIAISSCKGGVGKSTVAAAMAKELSQRGFSVGLLDADIYGPSVPTLFNQHSPKIFANENQQIIPITVGTLKIMSFGFLIGDAPAVMRGPIVTRYIQQLLHQVDWGELDYLFLDMPPGTGDIQLTITQNIQISGAIIVTTRQSLSLVDVSRGILMFEAVRVPMLGIIENMAFYICDNCKKKHYIFGGDENEPLKERFGLETLARLPIDKEFLTTFDKPFHNEQVSQAVDNAVRALGKTSISSKLTPKFQFDRAKITLEWPDGRKYAVSNRTLRLSCRCAVCVNELTGEQNLKEDGVRQDIEAKEITVLGNYALGIKWNDGHASGIYPYDTIEKLAGK